MDNREIVTAINDVLKKIHSNEKLSVDILAAKARKYAQANTTDGPVATAAQVLTKMASRQRFISRADFNKFINGLYTGQTKLLNVFADEMQQNLKQGPKFIAHAENEGQPFDKDYEKVADPVLVNALTNAFNGNGSVSLYSPEMGKKAKRACQAGLLSIGFEPKKVETFAGQEDIIICSATYETPKGDTRVLVPIEIKRDMALLPTMFISQAGFTDLSAEAVWQHIQATAGKALRVNGEKLLEVLSLAKNGQKEVASDVELAIINMKAARGEPAHDTNSIVGIQIDEPVKDVDISVPQNYEELAISQRLARADGIASFVHGDRVVEAGRKMLERKMAQFGYGGAQISIAGSDEQRIIFAVSIGHHIGFKVPVKVQANMVLPPTVLISNGEIKSFSVNGVNELVKSGSTDTRALAQASSNYHLRPTQLLQMVKDACEEGNITKAEDCINVLGEIDPNAQKVAIANMMIYLRNETGKEPGKEMTEMERLANQPVQDVPYMMSYKVFYPEGA